MTNIRPLIILYLPQEWEGYVRRPHWTSVARLTPVLAVEPPAPLLMGGDRRARRAVRRRHGAAVRQASDGVYLFRPQAFSSFGVLGRFPWLSRFDAGWLTRQVRRAVKQIQEPYTHTVNVVVKPQQFAVAGRWDTDLAVYEATDDSRVLPSQRVADETDWLVQRLTELEQRILRQTDLVIVSSEALLQSRSREHANVHYLPNCADVSHFAISLDPATVIPDDIARIPQPRLGYVGGINELVDVPLLEQLAKANTDWSVVLIGGIRGEKAFVNSDALDHLRALPNVYFIDHRRYDQLPYYVKALDAGLLPFVLNPWMESSSPNKTFQYLAAGKPVVSTDFPEARRVSDVVRIAHDADEFIAHCRTALSETGDEAVQQRVQLANENSTEVRATKLFKLIMSELEKG